MRFLAVFLAILAAACLASAAEQSLLAKFVSSSFEPDQSVQTTPLLAEGNYYLVSLAGEETYVVDASDGTAVLGSALLQEILLQDARNREGYDEKITSALEFPDKVRAAKKVNEDKCVQYIGDDGDPGCFSKESCLVSCFSVPQCEIIVQSSGFLESTMDWNSKRKEYDSLLAAFSSGIEAISFDPRAIDAKIGILANLSDLASNMSQNGIFLEKEVPGCIGFNATKRCYEYCPWIDYSPSLIASQSQSLASLKLLLSKIAQQQDRAGAILEKSSQNSEYVAFRGRDYADFRIRMQNDLRNLQKQSDELNKTVLDPQVNMMIGQLESISARSKNYSDGGYYRNALSLRPQFESLSNATSFRMASDSAAYNGLESGMDALSGEIQSSSWLIGNFSAAEHLKRLSALKVNYTAPLTLPQIYGANATLLGLDEALRGEIAAKAVQAGNSTALDLPSTQQPATVPDFAWVAAIIIAAALVYSFMLRSARRPPPPLPPLPPSQ